MKLLAVLALAAAALVAAVAIAAAPQPKGGDPCGKIKGCVVVTGPWVSVPAHGEATFLLECKKRQGVIAGFDALSGTKNVAVSWEGSVGKPVRAGTSTGAWAYFRALSTDGNVGVFQPFLGCIPPPKNSARSTLSARAATAAAAARPGKIDRWQTLVKLQPGKKQSASRVCGKKGERLVAGWWSLAFDTLNTAPNPALARFVTVELTQDEASVVASIKTDAKMPKTAYAEVQVGAVCSK